MLDLIIVTSVLLAILVVFSIVSGFVPFLIWIVESIVNLFRNKTSYTHKEQYKYSSEPIGEEFEELKGRECSAVMDLEDMEDE